MTKEDLKLLKQLPEIKDQTPTLLEVGGFPHYENVISNYLAYYFNPVEQHGLENLLLNAWATTIGLGKEENQVASGIYREVNTKKQARIDLLIVTPTRVYCIEHKVFHHAQDNPFDEYRTFVHESYPNREHHFFLLSLTPEEETSFVNICYPDFIEHIRDKLDQLPNKTLHQLFLEDLLQSIDNLARKKAMQKEALKVIQDNLKAFQNLSKHLNVLHREMESKVTEVKKAIEKKTNFPIQFKHIWVNNQKARSELKSVIFYTLKIEESDTIELKVRLTPEGWSVEIWNFQESLHLLHLVNTKELEIKFSDRLIAPHLPVLHYDSSKEEVVRYTEKLLKLIGVINTI